MTKEEKQIEKLKKLFEEFTVIDLIGFGRIVGAEEKDEYKDFKEEVFKKFLALDNKHRKGLVKLAKDIVIANRKGRG